MLAEDQQSNEGVFGLYSKCVNLWVEIVTRSIMRLPFSVFVFVQIYVAGFHRQNPFLSSADFSNGNHCLS